MKSVMNIQDLLEQSFNEDRSLVAIPEKDELFASTNFISHHDMLRSLLNIQSTSKSSLYASKFESPVNIPTNFTGIGSDFVAIQSWKNTENISARLIDHYDDLVILECLVDKEFKVYEEREFKKSLFSDYELIIGNIFYLRIFERKNEIRLEIHNDPKLTFKEDFPELDFTSIFIKSKLFKK